MGNEGDKDRQGQLGEYFSACIEKINVLHRCMYHGVSGCITQGSLFIHSSSSKENRAKNGADWVLYLLRALGALQLNAHAAIKT
jgi:hypothetical protein